ncbi:MAG: DUF433 domain-containing protein, partial [Verrucomicrobia bacterium]|nr:DUF433 domain-containing protein [Verrucomicrobiota bacterium]
MSVLTQRIVSEIESAPEPIQAEVLDFLLFVKARAGGTQETAAAPIRHTPGISGGEACIGGTRIAVWMLEDARRAGVGDLDLLKDYPGLGVYDLDAAWRYVETHRDE